MTYTIHIIIYTPRPQIQYTQSKPKGLQNAARFTNQTPTQFSTHYPKKNSQNTTKYQFQSNKQLNPYNSINWPTQNDKIQELNNPIQENANPHKQ